MAACFTYFFNQELADLPRKLRILVFFQFFDVRRLFYMIKQNVSRLLPYIFYIVISFSYSRAFQ